MPEPVPLKRIPRPEGGTIYDEYRGHPLNGCPQYILDAARRVLDDCVIVNDVHQESSHPIADAVVAALRERGYING